MLTFGNIRIKKNLDNFFKILIIKFGAPGDVLRTTPILESLRKKYRHCYIAWLTWRASLELLENNPMIDKLLSCNNSAKEALTEKYDMLLSFDKDPTAISLATKAKAKKKFGFKIDRFGALNVFNDNSLYALQLGIDNRLKFSGNSKTYQEIIYEMSELKRDYGPYIFNLDERCVLYGRKVLYKFGMKPYHTVIGLNTGAGKIFLTKKWPITYFVQLTKMLAKLKNVKIVLLGGGDERAINKIISSKTKQVAVNLGTHYSKKEFAGIVNNCDIIVTADTLCMHIAIALKKKIIALFGPTAEMEVDLYGSGKKISSRIPCSPCYRLRCHDTKCMKSIKPDSVFKEIKQFISQYDK
ncbi:MAG: glycosyltransferase family 9 protein, partial [Candidatus Omnitrophica bacterium]|nr:glycosyltransferase family 9 protein [Candidatus Omnitrophota bacterium]